MKRRPDDDRRQCGGPGLHIFRIVMVGGSLTWITAHSPAEARSLFPEYHPGEEVESCAAETLRGEELLETMRAHGRLPAKE